MNIELLQLAEHLGVKYRARVTSWGRTKAGNDEVGGTPNSWHLWSRGANAIDLKPDNPIDRVGIAMEARGKGYQAVVYEYSVHIEVPW